MKKILCFIFLLISLNPVTMPAYSATIKETDSELCEAFKYALNISLRKPIDYYIPIDYRIKYNY